MFTCINPINVKRKKRKIIYPEIKHSGDITFYSLNLPVIKGSPDWSGIVGEEPLLIPKSLVPPENITSFGSKSWKTELAEVVLISLLEKHKCDCIIYDRNAELLKYVCEIAQYARSTAVFTNESAEFDSMIDFCRKEFGTVLAVNTLAGQKEGYSFLPFGHLGYPIKPEFKKLRLNIINDDIIDIPEKYLENIPLGISTVDYSEALCKFCNKGTAKNYIDKSYLAKIKY